ncbi:MAG: porin family protein [Prevotella sp.]|nr:porin family protein [Prevotella sp.]
MKKILLSIAMMAVSLTSFAQYSSGGFSLEKENMYYGVRIGLNIASLSGDFDLGTKVGMNLAGVIGLRVSNAAPVFLESGLYYTEGGAKKDGLTQSYNCLEIPLLIKYGFKAGDNFAILPYIGPTFAMALKTSTSYKEGKTSVSTDLLEVNKPNMGFKIGCGAEYNNLYLEAGYRLGITDMAKDNPTGHANAFYVNFGLNF